MKKTSFSKKLRLLRSNHFLFVLKKPIQINTENFVISSRYNELNYPRIGITIIKKNIKKSHKRNCIKRLIRESFRKHKNILPSMDFVVFVKKNVNFFQNNSMFIQELDSIWNQYYHKLEN